MKTLTVISILTIIFVGFLISSQSITSDMSSNPNTQNNTPPVSGVDTLSAQ